MSKEVIKVALAGAAMGWILSDLGAPVWVIIVCAIGLGWFWTSDKGVKQ